MVVDSAAWWPVSPFVRRRWRRRFGLPDGFVASVGVAAAPPLDERTTYEALFLCSAAVVDAEHVLPALALGTPVVCTASAAAAVGAVDGVHVLVVDDPVAAQTAAEALTGDDARAATLARAGRGLVMAHDAAVAPEERSDDAPPTRDARERVAVALAELGTPPDSDVARRVAGHVASFDPTSRAPDVVASPPLPDDASARRVAEAYGLPTLVPAPVPPAPTLRDRLRGKSASEIVRAVGRRVRRDPPR